MVDGERHTEVTATATAGDYEIEMNGAAYRISSNWQPGEPLFTGTVNSEYVAIQIERERIDYRLSHAGADLNLLVLTPEGARLSRHMIVKAPPDTSRLLLSPMPGLLVSVAVKAGETVKAGQELAVVEAMKMENSLRAERDGVVAAIVAEAGATLEVDQPIIEFE